MATKIARNVITFGGLRVVKEAQRLAEAAKVDPVKLIDVIETSDPEGATLCGPQ
jgi:3-hydroxyisobutyrate dehydrogenase-like beta-hydroxyacid dehydrogenase